MLFGAQTAKSDALMDAIMGWNTGSYKVNSYSKQKTPPETDDDEYGYDRTEPEHYSWDNLYIDPYENTEIIIDPYGDSEDSGCD
jgi:hypothetical protein